jgi:hypothetical protein
MAADISRHWVSNAEVKGNPYIRIYSIKMDLAEVADSSVLGSGRAFLCQFLIGGRYRHCVCLPLWRDDLTHHNSLSIVHHKAEEKMSPRKESGLPIVRPSMGNGQLNPD